jgi:ubiquinone/menaquinone biosynthesis C-methylase UbiE
MTPPTEDAGDLARFQHPRFAKVYAGVSAEAEARGGTEHRRRLLAGLSGSVIEVGAGHGLNFAHYPPAVTAVLAVEPDDTMRRLAERAAADAPVPVRVVAGHADALPADDASHDAAVASLVLCSVPDQGRALAELRRVLVPGGRLRYYEHVRSRGPKGVVQDAVRPLWRRMAGGCNPNRRTGDAVRAAGFAVEDEDRFTWRATRFSPALDHLVGSARTPASGSR